MAISSQELFELAKELAEREKEVYWRSSVSRAYYSIYHECQSFANQLPEAPYDSFPKGVHDKFIKQFSAYPGNDEFSRTIRAIGYILGNFKDIRALADYKLSDSFEHSRTREAFQYVNNIRIKLEKLSKIVPQQEERPER